MQYIVLNYLKNIYFFDSENSQKLMKYKETEKLKFKNILL